jgi:hypothetical protein
MTGKSDQKIVAICDFTNRMSEVIVHGVRLAQILNKELCLVAFWKTQKQKKEVHEKMSSVAKNLVQGMRGLAVSSLLLEKTLRANLPKLAEVYNAILVVDHQTNVDASLKAFRESSIGFLFVNGKSPEFLGYRNVLLPVDFRTASKEAALWASYLGRFNRANVHISFARESGRAEALAVKSHVASMQRLFQRLNVNSDVTEGKSGSWGICGETLSNARGWNGDVFIFAGSRYISLLDRLIGLPEQKIVKRAGNLPVLIINPTREGCVLCD